VCRDCATLVTCPYPHVIHGRCRKPSSRRGCSSSSRLAPQRTTRWTTNYGSTSTTTERDSALLARSRRSLTSAGARSCSAFQRTGTPGFQFLALFQNAGFLSTETFWTPSRTCCFRRSHRRCLSWFCGCSRCTRMGVSSCSRTTPRAGLSPTWSAGMGTRGITGGAASVRHQCRRSKSRPPTHDDAR